MSCHILQACRRHRQRDILVPSPANRLPTFHVQVPRNNQLRLPRFFRHFRLHVYDGCPVSRCQVTSHDVPAPLSCCQMTHNDIRAELVYHLNCKDGGILIEYCNANLMLSRCHRRDNLIPCRKPHVNSLCQFGLLEDPDIHIFLSCTSQRRFQPTVLAVRIL